MKLPTVIIFVTKWMKYVSITVDIMGNNLGR